MMKMLNTRSILLHTDNKEYIIMDYILVAVMGAVMISMIGYTVYLLWKDSKESTNDLVELFELKECLSNAEFQASTQASMRLMKTQLP